MGLSPLLEYQPSDVGPGRPMHRPLLRLPGILSFQTAERVIQVYRSDFVTLNNIRGVESLPATRAGLSARALICRHKKRIGIRRIGSPSETLILMRRKFRLHNGRFTPRPRYDTGDLLTARPQTA